MPSMTLHVLHNRLHHTLFRFHGESDIFSDSIHQTESRHKVKIPQHPVLHHALTSIIQVGYGHYGSLGNGVVPKIDYAAGTLKKGQ